MYISFRFYRSLEGGFHRENTKSTVGINDQSEINGNDPFSLRVSLGTTGDLFYCKTSAVIFFCFYFILFATMCVCNAIAKEWPKTRWVSF